MREPLYKAGDRVQVTITGLYKAGVYMGNIDNAEMLTPIWYRDSFSFDVPKGFSGRYTVILDNTPFHFDSTPCFYEEDMVLMV